MLSFVCCEVKKADDKGNKGMDFYLDDISKMKLMVLSDVERKKWTQMLLGLYPEWLCEGVLTI